MTARNRQSGMTLVEVVVASVILGLIMLATVTALRTFGQTYNRLLVATDATSEKREVSRFLRLALRDAMNEPRAFVGDSRAMAWVTPLDRVGSAGGIQYLRLMQTGDALLLSFAPFNPVTVGNADPEWGSVVDDYVLVDALDSVEFAYRLPVDEQWSADFDGQSAPTIPGLVMVRIVADGEAWPPIIVDLAGALF